MEPTPEQQKAEELAEITIGKITPKAYRELVASIAAALVEAGGPNKCKHCGGPCVLSVAAGPQGDLISSGATHYGAFQSGWDAGFQEAQEPDRFPQQNRCEVIYRELFPAGHPTGECVWTSDDRYDGYITGCGNTTVLLSKSGRDRYCRFCGKQLVEHPTGEKE